MYTKTIKIGLILSLAFFQTLKAQEFVSSLHFSTESTMGFAFDVKATQTSKMLYGMAMYAYTDNGKVGTDYSQVFGPAAAQGKIYQILRNTPDASFYVRIGYEVHPLLVVKGLLGTTTRSTYYNGYDTRQILSPSGYFHTSTVDKSTLSYGVMTSFTLPKNILIEIGFTNQEQLIIGIGYRYNFD